MTADGPANLRDADGAACRAVIQDGTFVLVDFWAEWCGPCRSLQPVLQELAERHPELTVVKVDVEANGELADEYSVRSVPSLLLFKAGELVGQLVGKVPYVTLERLVAKHA